ncbi:hypothetical protein GDO81_008614 [Engystomops pustulosus]|uniref:Uncharacterized protein n=1 Tax=Engystomops pustulosus TaxID=76066 RepID=A0AAV7CFX9_ENGPU|nr:hypothetical protein GDO81_008614 [Engystomops pustulosus]
MFAKISRLFCEIESGLGNLKSPVSLTKHPHGQGALVFSDTFWVKKLMLKEKDCYNFSYFYVMSLRGCKGSGRSLARKSKVSYPCSYSDKFSLSACRIYRTEPTTAELSSAISSAQ